MKYPAVHGLYSPAWRCELRGRAFALLPLFALTNDFRKYLKIPGSRFRTEELEAVSKTSRDNLQHIDCERNDATFNDAPK